MIKTFKSKKTWLKNRRIGGTDLATIVNGVGRWETLDDLYNRLINGKKKEQKENTLMKNGKTAEKAIKTLFLINNPNLKEITPKEPFTLVINGKEPLLTLSPDCLTINRVTKEHGFLEIKNKTIYSEKAIGNYLSNLKEEEPQYYYQLLHYFIVENKIKNGYLVVAFNLLKKEGDAWQYDKTIIESLYLTRETVKEDIKTVKKKLKDFIENNVKKRVRPQTKLIGQKEDKIEWTKLSNITILNQ